MRENPHPRLSGCLPSQHLNKRRQFLVFQPGLLGPLQQPGSQCGELGVQPPCLSKRVDTLGCLDADPQRALGDGEVIALDNLAFMRKE